MKVIIPILYTIFGLGIIVAQTTVLGSAFFRGFLYDLLIPMVVFLRLNLPTKKGGTLVLVFGFVMDLFSGGIFGLYITVYFWIFFLVRGVSSYFDVQGTMFRSALIAVCVLAQNLFFVFAVHPMKGSQLLMAQIGPVMGQIILAAMTGPPFLVLLEKIHKRVETALAFSGNTRRILRPDER